MIFKSFEVDPIDRTSLDVSKAINGRMDGIEFDLAMNGFSSFGYIFRTMTTGGSKVDFLYTPNEGGNFKVIVDGQETGLNLAVNQEEARRNYWRTIRLNITEKGISLTSGEIVMEYPLVVGQGFSKLIFGVNELPDLQTVDCPPFIIRDIKVSRSGVLKHHWPADEIEGHVLDDIVSDQPLRAINAEWRTAQSYRWNAIGEMNGNMSLVVGHDPNRQSILWVQPERIQSFDLTNAFAFQFAFESDTESRFGLYDVFNDQLVSYDMEPVGVSRFQIDTAARLISQKINPTTPIQNLWLSAPFINPVDSNLMLLGGYGFFTYKNSLWSHDQATQEWSLVPLRGDTLAPRYHHAIAKGPVPGQFYVFGGIGNLTGKQELGQQQYYDLHLLDTRDSTLQKLWELTEVESHFSVVNQMVFLADDRVLYVLGYRAFGEVNNLALIKIDVNQPKVEVVGDSITFIQKGFDQTQAGLFQNEKSGELIAYTLVNEEQQAKLKLYSILFPPETVPEISSSSMFKPKWYWFVILLVAFLLVAFVRRKNATSGSSEELRPLRDPEKNAVRLWGGFTVYDANGQNISDQFSPKIKELFLLLFFNSVGEAQGIKAQKIYEKVWPGYERAKAKNALGVTMGRLRAAVEQVESVVVVNENGAWKLDWKNEVPTDYHLTMLSLDQLQKHFSETVLDGLIKVVERGPFLPNTEIEWLDDYKGKVNYRVTSSLLEISNQVAEEERKIKIAAIILGIDDLHEQAARLKIGALVTLGKHGLANDFYEEFSKKYQELYQENFPRSFKEMKG